MGDTILFIYIYTVKDIKSQKQFIVQKNKRLSKQCYKM